MRYQDKKTIALLIVLSAVLALSVGTSSAQEPKEIGATGAYTFLGGYGLSHPGLGKTKQYVETLDLILRYEKPLSNRLGASWYEGYHSLAVELPVHIVTDPGLAPMVGLNFLANWTFTGYSTATPYVFGGGGPLYSDAEIPGMGAHLNGSWQFGLGNKWATRDGHILHVEYRYHHISNGGTEEPNDPLNSSKVLFGISF